MLLRQAEEDPQLIARLIHLCSLIKFMLLRQAEEDPQLIARLIHPCCSLIKFLLLRQAEEDPQLIARLIKEAKDSRGRAMDERSDAS